MTIGQAIELIKELETENQIYFTLKCEAKEKKDWKTFEFLDRKMKGNTKAIELIKNTEVDVELF